jgi:Uma2 family endonuclease
MQAQTRHKLTPEEYLAIERTAEYKSEYYNGEMFAMAGASPAHTRIVSNLVSSLDTLLMDRDCDVHSNDLRVKVVEEGEFLKYTYPDVLVVCGKAAYDEADSNTLTNPTVIIEVLSESTENYDRGRKFEHYRRLKSLQEYVLISQSRCQIERYQRRSDGTWILHELLDLDQTLELESIDCTIPLRRVYRRVEF